MDEIEVGTMVVWAGKRGFGPLRNAAGFGRVERIAHHDSNSLRVMWVVEGKDLGYTWERRKNLLEARPVAVAA